MIRPLTVVTFLMACGSGLYLYQSKHEVQVLDRTIERTVHETNALREQSRLLVTQWTMLNSPDRLRPFSDTYLHLKTTSPSQFTSLADLDNRLPATQVEAPAVGAEEELVPIVGVPKPEPIGGPDAAVAGHEALPVPPVPVARLAPVVAPTMRPMEAVAPTVRPAEAKVALARPVTTNSSAHPPAPEARSTEQHATEQHVAQRAADPHAAVHETSALVVRPAALPAPKPIPVNGPVYMASTSPRTQAPAGPVSATQTGPFSGSLLGMAHGSMPLAPRPTPVNASYNAN